jgi:ABC-type sugar transport system, periplasmic component
MLRKVGCTGLIILLLGLFAVMPAMAEDKGTIGISSSSEDNPYYQTLAANAKKAFEDAGYKVIVADAQAKVEKQANDVDNFIAMGVKGILLTPIDSYALSSAVNRAHEAGIPVVCCDSAVYNAPYASQIESDNYSAGYVVGEYFVKYFNNLAKKGAKKPPFKVVCGLYSQLNACRDRQQGFEDAIAKGPKGLIEIIEKLEIKFHNEECGYEVGGNFLVAHPDVDGIFYGCNDLAALGTLRAIEEAGRKDVIVAGVDGQVPAVNAINNNTAFKVSGAQYPQVTGYVGGLTLLDVIAGKPVKNYIKVACHPIHLPFQPFEQDPKEFVEKGTAISRAVDVEYPLTEKTAVK